MARHNSAEQDKTENNKNETDQNRRIEWTEQSGIERNGVQDIVEERGRNKHIGLNKKKQNQQRATKSY